MSELQLFIPITKVDAAKRLVYGTITEEVADKSGEIFDYDTGKEAVQKWSDDFAKATKGESKGNLRAMHDNVAAGKFTDIVFDDDNKRIEGVAKVVDEDEWLKVQEGVYTGFSIGGGYAKRWKDPDNPGLTRYTPELCEVSLVDNPCVPTATFMFIKEDGSTELRKFNSQEVDMTEENKAEDATETQTETITEDRPQNRDGVKQVWLAKDGSTHDTKAEALRKNVDVDAQAAAAPVMEAIDKIDQALTKKEGKADGEEEDEEESDEEAEKAADGEESEDEAEKAEESDEEAAKAAAAEAAAKAEEPKDLKKGMYGVSRFADVLQSIQYLQQDTQWEADFEGDNSELPEKIKAWLAEGGTLLQAMCAEEVAELTAAKAAGTDGLNKSAATGTQGDEGGDLAKVTAERDALNKVISEMTPKLETLLKRVEALEAQPMPAKGVKKAISKEEDNGGNKAAAEEFNKHLEGLSPEQRSNELMKLALRHPIVVKP